MSCVLLKSWDCITVGRVACLACIKPWAPSSAPHKVVVVALTIMPAIGMGWGNDREFKTILSYRASSRSVRRPFLMGGVVADRQHDLKRQSR